MKALPITVYKFDKQDDKVKNNQFEIYSNDWGRDGLLTRTSLALLYNLDILKSSDMKSFYHFCMVGKMNYGIRTDHH